MSSLDAQPEAQNDPVPVLYKAPVTLNAELHGDLKVSRRRSYGYAKNVNSVPVVLSEFLQLLAHYPVVFGPGDPPMLIALLGIRQDENLFVDDGGNWTPNTYIPAYVRRYPFILADMGNSRYGLAAELDPAFFGEEDSPLFEQGRPAKAAELALRFCLELQKEFEATQKFCKAIMDSGLLRPKVFNVADRSGRKMQLSGFAAIDPEMLDTLNNRTANAWRKQHWLGPVYWHIASMERLKSFPGGLEERQTKL